MVQRAAALIIATIGIGGSMVVAMPPATAGATSRHCGSFTAGGFRFAVAVDRGREVKCSTAVSVLRTFMRGGGKLHGPPNGPAYLQSWKLPYGWSCGHGAGGGACIRGGSNYKTAHDYIVAEMA